MLRRAAYLAYRQLTKRITKLVATLSGICVAIILIFMQMVFENSLYDSTLNTPRALDADIILTANNFSTLSYAPPSWFSRNILFEAYGVNGVSSVLPFYVAAVKIANVKGGDTLTAWLYGIPVQGNVLQNEEISRQLNRITNPNVVIFDRKSRHGFQSIIKEIEETGHADVITPFGSANLQHVVYGRGLFSLGPTFSIDGTLITSDINFNRITSQPLDRISLALVKVDPHADVAKMKEQLQKVFAGRAQVFLKSEFIEHERQVYKDKTPIGIIFNVGLLVGIIVGIVFIYQALHSVTEDNMGEYAVLRAMGYEQSFFISLMGFITLTFTAAAYLPSLIIARYICYVVENKAQLAMNLSVSDAILVLWIVLLMGVVATVFVIRKLEKANPVDLFS